MQGKGPLAGVRVLDLSERSPSSAVASMVLGRLGAEVIHVEPEGGDPLRALPATNVWLAGTRSVVVTDREVADGSWARLRDSADLILDTAHPHIDKPAGLANDLRPDQVRVVLTSYPRAPGDVAPRPDEPPVYGELLEAELGYTQQMADLFSNARQADIGRPAFLAWPEAVFGAAWQMQIAAIAGLIEKVRTGRGQTVTTSLVDGLAMMSVNGWIHGGTGNYMVLKLQAYPVVDNVRNIVQLFETSDNWIYIHTGPRGSFNGLMKVMGREDLVTDKVSTSFFGNTLDQQVAEDLRAELVEKFKTENTQHWFEALTAAGLAVMPALRPGEALELEQMRANQMVEEVNGRKMLGRMSKFARTPTGPAGDVPSVGQHSAELFRTTRKLALTSVRTANRPSGDRLGPLDGITVLDFGAYIAGPYANRVLADLGARVIKVEELAGDPMRGPFNNFSPVQRGKESIAVNLKSDEGKAAIQELSKQADIVSHNMRNGVMDRLGMGYDALSALNPNLIYSHSSGYGNEGPWAMLPAFEPLHSTMTGMLYRTGGTGNRPMMYLSHMDYGGGLAGAVSLLSALLEREITGRGQFMEVPQVASGLLAMSDVYIENGKTIETFALDKDARGHAPTNALYDTSDGHLVIACGSEAEWRAVGDVLGLSGVGWPGYAETRLRSVTGHPVFARIQGALSGITTADAVARLRAAGVGAAAPGKPDFAALSRGDGPIAQLFTTEHDPRFGEFKEVGQTIRFAATPGRHARPAPELGGATRTILSELGRSPGEIERLIAAGVFVAPTDPDDKADAAE